MKKFFIMVLMTAAATMIFAQGNRDAPGRFYDWEPRELEVISGTLEEGDYGHLEVRDGDKHYLLGQVDFYPAEMLEELTGADVVLDGFEGPVMFTRDKEEFLGFHPVKAVVNGDVLDLSEFGMTGPAGGMMGYGPGSGNRGSGMSGRRSGARRVSGGRGYMNGGWCYDEDGSFTPGSGFGMGRRGWIDQEETVE